MYGILSGFEIGKRALLSQQFGLNVTGHNIANVNTPGFSRQKAIINTTHPQLSIKGALGTGVDAAGVSRYRDIFYDSQYRQENQNLGRWSALQRTFEQLETVFNEPSDQGLNTLMDNFWNAWQDLSTNPESRAAQSTLKEQSLVLVNAFHQQHKLLKDLEQNINDDIAQKVVEVNNYADQIASLNRQIAYAELSGGKANDLRDKRDLLVDELSKVVDVNTVEQSAGSVTVYVGAMSLVERDIVNRLSADKNYEEGVMRSKVVWSGTLSTVIFNNGELAGLCQIRDELIPEYVDALNQMAETLVSGVNTVHQQGYALDGTTTGIDFLDPERTTAQDIALSSDILSNLGNIAASQGGAPGNNANALAIAALRSSLLMNDSTATLGDFYSSLIGILGSRSQEAEDIKDSQNLLLAQIKNGRQAVQDVSLDEETTNLIRFQHAYEAAVRVITTMDEVMATIINSVGKVA
ncbi:MAG TPA: flagellar hook-associated protein FlgK [candidate division Zixibacteria bacterium]